MINQTIAFMYRYFILIILIFAALGIIFLTYRLRVTETAPKEAPVRWTKCWNVVIAYNDTYYWPDGCRGTYKEGFACTEALIALTDSELTDYASWVSAGKPPVAMCPPGSASAPELQ